MLDLRVNPASHVPPSVQLVDTVLDAVAKRLPDLPIVYFGDNANTPDRPRRLGD